MRKYTFILFLGGLLLSLAGPAQSWKTYPYHEPGSEVYFPSDEGQHAGEPVEWWYLNARVTGQESGHVYSFMVSYFRYAIMGFEGFRIFNISNETTGVFYDETAPLDYLTLSDTGLDIHAQLFLAWQERWETLKDENGELLPFRYHLETSSLNGGGLDLYLDTKKRPLMVGGTGFLYQGESSYTWYYSLTELEVTGELSFEFLTEPVSGVAWMDHQYGSQNPLESEPWEWLSAKLSNGVDIVLGNLFTDDNRVPDTITFRSLSAYLDETTTAATAGFDLERLGYVWMPDGEVCYARQWRLTADEPALDLLITTTQDDHEVTLPFRFFEGMTTISGTMDGAPITGWGFAELLHQYEDPQVEILAPTGTEPWNLADPVVWQLTNPDDGRPVWYDVAVSHDGQQSYATVAQSLTDTAFLWDAVGFPLDALYHLRVTAYSIDTTLVNTAETETPVAVVSSFEELSGEGGFRVFPNPAREQVTVEWPQPTGAVETVQLTNGQGKRVGEYHLSTNARTVTLDTRFLPAGAYWLTVRTGRQTASRKVVIVK